MPGTVSRYPFLSIVLCTFDRADLLQQTLESLCHQTLDRREFEIVLIDDGSRDDTREVVRSFESRLPLSYVHQENTGLASARNRGVSLAKGEIVLFLDDDATAAPGLLEAHCATHRRFADARYAVLGLVEAHSTVAADPVLHFLGEVDDLLLGYGSLRDGDILDFSRFRGGRSSCKRSFMLQHGTFDPAFRFACDDTELAWRLSRHGFKVVYDSRALVTRAHKVSFDEFCRARHLHGESSFMMSRLHPEETVQRWTEVSGAGPLWRKIAPVFDVLLRSAREMDRIVGLRREAGLTLGEHEMTLLGRSYWTAFRACKMKGMADRAAAMGCELA